MLNFLISDIWFGDGSDLEWFVALTFGIALNLSDNNIN